ncbi:hypothetical protein MMC30_000733 [Trapelia coarctata]|nr:hypothetical protein [Trapelia coarctata]
MSTPTPASTAPMLPVLITGAGPTGLLFAHYLTRLQIPYILIDRAPSAGLTSRAIVIHARTLEYYRTLSLSARIVSAGRKMERIEVRHAGRSKGGLTIGNAGEGQSKFPFVLSLTQDEHEEIMGEELEKTGGGVRRGVELVGAEELGDRVRVTLRDVSKEGGEEEVVEVAYLCGCDGAHSKVRELAGIEMVGGTYSQRFFVVDVDATGEAAEGVDVNLCTRDRDFCLALPLKRKGGMRLVGWVPQGMGEHVEFKDVEDAARKTTGVVVEKVRWFSTYRIHARVAERFRQGRLFVLGDAAHLHSPVGGQGMNTGLGDAANLAWKIAAVMKGEAKEEVLETYEVERRAFARVLVDTTDYAFTLLTDAGYKGYLLRNWFMPYVLPFIWSFRALQRYQYQKVSQIEVQYRASALSEGKMGKVQGGDRLPWVEFERGGDNHENLGGLGWRVHVFGDLEGEVRKGLEGRDMQVNVFPWEGAAEKKGFVRGEMYLVRPDGHVGMVCGQGEVESLYAYLERWGIS